MSKSARNAAKTAELLEAGMEVLWTNGYNGAIVKAAGVPKGSFIFISKVKMTLFPKP